MQLKISVLLLTLSAVYAENGILQTVSDDDLLQLIKEREKLIVLFSKFMFLSSKVNDKLKLRNSLLILLIRVIKITLPIQKLVFSTEHDRFIL